MRWELNAWLKMAEMFLSVIVFGLHAMAAVWWSSVSHVGWKTMSLLLTTCLCGPLVPQMFRTGPYFYTSQDLNKPINAFVILYCFGSYVAGCALVSIDTFKTRERITSRNVDIVLVICAAVLSVLFAVDFVFTLKKDDDDDD